MADHAIETSSRMAVHVTSFEGFFRDTSNDVYRALFASLGDADLAEEATSEAYARAYAKWESVRGYDNPSGWVYRVGLNWATSRLRRRRYRDSRQVPEISSIDPEPHDPELIHRLRKLKQEHREVVVLRYFFDLEQSAIADVLGIPVGTVRSRLSRALSILERTLANHEGDRS